MKREYRICLAVWAMLMGLLMLSCGSAFVAMGAWNTVASFLIATLKVALVAYFFMHLKDAPGVLRLYAVIGLFVLALLFCISGSDYATRYAAMPLAIHASM